MKLKDKYMQLAIRGRRTIVISDIHGEKALFQQLLDQVGFSADDILIIGGDIIDKGQDSIGTMHYVFELLKQPNVHMIEGNCDRILEELYEDWLYDYMAYRRTFVHDYLEKVGRTPADYPSQQQLADDILAHYGHYREQLAALPTAIETEDFLFVHAGVDDDYLETDRERALSMPNFYKRHHQLDKYIVVGHYPACNYVEGGLFSHAVKINDTRKVIAIDGGNQVKPSGQLNALIIEADGSLKSEFVDAHPEALVIQSFEVSYQTPHTFTYPEFDIMVEEIDPYFTLAVHSQSGTEFMVKTEYIQGDCGHYRLKDDYTDLFLDVEVGKRVKVVDDTCLGYILIKKGSLVGWVPEEVLAH
ncbi:hypothetical protein ERX35_006240 [Macrococcus equipercicus]|uniref:Calcineurin-like phosphoesterase domain-containing protein n=1 Tax=Macrococcus equipercicus TaxID=69967 RepID=A0ABQ6R967_9STAP|nr:metallophosphoesterase [Macrococcus equipercicus]KAA1039670.1 hypothetical protein ERX35_006240 [Macrococcus equipercicus]